MTLNSKNPGAYSLVFSEPCIVPAEHGLGWINIWSTDVKMFDELTIPKCVLTCLGCLNIIKIEM